MERREVLPGTVSGTYRTFYYLNLCLSLRQAAFWGGGRLTDTGHDEVPVHQNRPHGSNGTAVGVSRLEDTEQQRVRWGTGGVGG